MRADPALLKALARSFLYQRLLDEGRCVSVTEMASAEKIERAYLGSLLRLTLLAPEIVEDILDGRALDDLTLPRLLEPFPTSWADQQHVRHGSVGTTRRQLASGAGHAGEE
jgi:hypothetical protein